MLCSDITLSLTFVPGGRLSHCRYHNPDHSLLSPFSLFWQSEHTSYSYTNTTDIPVGVQSRRCSELCSRKKLYVCIYIYLLWDGDGAMAGLDSVLQPKVSLVLHRHPHPPPAPASPFPILPFSLLCSRPRPKQ